MLNEKRRALCDEELMQITGGNSGPMKQWYTCYPCSCGHMTTVVGKNTESILCEKCRNPVATYTWTYQ